MKFNFISLSVITLLSSVSEAWEEDHRCWDLICDSKKRGKKPEGGFRKGIPCDCLSGDKKCDKHKRALTSEGESELYMRTNNTNNEIDNFNFTHDEKLEDTHQVDEEELAEFDDEDLISYMDSPNLRSDIVGGAEEQRNLELESDNEKKKTLRQLQNKNKNKNKKNNKKNKKKKNKKNKNKKKNKKKKKKKKKKKRTRAPTSTPGPPHGRPSKLALGWRKWSCWQYETKRRNWCATVRGSNQLEIQDCDKVNDKWSLIKVDNHVLIKDEKKNKCWTANRKSLLLQTCNGSSSQLWDLDSSAKTHTKLGDLANHLFEIQPAKSQSNCITQNHHPKAGEKLSVQPCSTSRGLGHQTNYWERFK
jgi:hypothetical protein